MADISALPGMGPSAASLATPQNTNATWRKIAWRIVPLLALSFLAAYIDRVNIAFAKAPMLAHLHWSEASFGLGGGLFFIGYILLEIPSNLILARIGARIWLARIMITWGIVTALIATISSTAAFDSLRFLLGCAEAGFMPGVLFYLSLWFPEKYRSRIVALFMLSIPSASIIGAPLSGLILGKCAGLWGIEGWRWLFALEALPPIMLGALILACLPAGPLDARFLSAAERAWVARLLAAEARAGTTHAVRDSLADRRIWLIGLIDAAILLGLYAIAFWLPSIIRSHHVSDPITVGLLSALPQIAAAISMFAIGAHSDAQQERRWHIAIPMFLGAALLAVAVTSDAGLAAQLLLLSAANAAILGAIPPLWAVPTSFLSGPAAAAGLALAGSVANTAGFAATYVVGFSVSAGYGIALPFTLFALCLAAAAIAALWLPRPASK